MKLFLNKNCPHCESLDFSGIAVQVTYTDSDSYQGVTPPSVPLLQFDSGIQLQGGDIIGDIFNEIRKAK